MASMRYKGALGAFTYDPLVFRLDMDIDGKEYLAYTGKERDGSRIRIPDGIRDATGMFQDRDITSQPRIPDSVVVADCMFAGCDSLKRGGPLPKGLARADYMYACCPSLETVAPLPEGLQSAQGMFDGCKNLAQAPETPKGLVNRAYFLQGCEKLGQPDYVMEQGMDDLSDVPMSQVFVAMESQELQSMFQDAHKKSVGIGRPKEIPTGFQTLLDGISVQEAGLEVGI